MAFEKPVVVIDNGSRHLKAGFACDNHPVTQFRTVVGRPAYLKGKYTVPGRADYYDVYVGDEAIGTGDDYELYTPIVKGRIQNWDNMERIWYHLFYRELKVAPEDRAVMMCASPSISLEDKVKCCQVFFEVLNVPELCIQPTAVLALYGSGHTTGITVDIGYDSCNVNPVYQGGLIKYAQMTPNIAAKEISQFVKDSFVKRDIDLGREETEIIDNILKKHLYVTKDSTVPYRNHELYHTLPDGKTIDVRNEMFCGGELFFQPDLVKGEPSGFFSLPRTIFTSCMKCDSDIRSELNSAVVLAGGLSMMPGLPERLSFDYEALMKKPVNVLRSIESYVVSWLGGAALAGISNSRNFFLTKKQFEEHGTKIVKNRFL